MTEPSVTYAGKSEATRLEELEGENAALWAKLSQWSTELQRLEGENEALRAQVEALREQLEDKP